MIDKDLAEYISELCVEAYRTPEGGIDLSDPVHQLRRTLVDNGATLGEVIAKLQSQMSAIALRLQMLTDCSRLFDIK